jgi:hypothetical protein
MTKSAARRFRAFGAAAVAALTIAACTGSDLAAPAGGKGGRDAGKGGRDTSGDAGIAGRAGERSGGAGGGAGTASAAGAGSSRGPVEPERGGRAATAEGGRGGLGQGSGGEAGALESGQGGQDSSSGDGGDAGEQPSDGGGETASGGNAGWAGTSGNVGSSGTSGGLVSGGGNAGGGMGGAPSDPCAPVGCTDQIRTFSGDVTNQVSIVGGVGVKNWYWIAVRESNLDDSRFRANVGVTVTLTSPPGVDYDLVWTCQSDCSDVAVMSAPARDLSGHSESISHAEYDSGGMPPSGAGSDQSFMLHVGIITVQPAQDACIPWTLTISTGPRGFPPPGYPPPPPPPPTTPPDPPYILPGPSQDIPFVCAY